MSLFLLILSIYCFPSAGPQSGESKNIEIGRNPLGSETVSSIKNIDSLTSGFFSQTIAVDAPHSYAIHSIAFNVNHTFDYRIMDDRFRDIDVYQGTWIYRNDSVRIVVEKKWIARASSEHPLENSNRRATNNSEVKYTWVEGSSRYYPFLKDHLVYKYKQYQGGQVCFPLRYQSQDCLLKSSSSFLHELNFVNERN